MRQGPDRFRRLGRLTEVLHSSLANLRAPIADHLAWPLVRRGFCLHEGATRGTEDVMRVTGVTGMTGADARAGLGEREGMGTTDSMGTIDSMGTMGTMGTMDSAATILAVRHDGVADFARHRVWAPDTRGGSEP